MSDETADAMIEIGKIKLPAGSLAEAMAKDLSACQLGTLENELAEARQQRSKALNLCESLWNLICNVDWDKQIPEWRQFAERDRDVYLSLIRVPVLSTSAPQQTPPADSRQPTTKEPL